jgi:hypothetical protein
MPSWKKVITSGSDAALNSLNVTTSLTASGNIYPTGLGVDRQILKTDGDGNISFGYAEEIVAIVKNVSGGTLQKGTPVHATASGASGNIVGIIAASASDATTMPATFVLNETLNDGDEGEALSSGFIQGVNTSMFEVGQVVYVGELGGYTGTKPTGSNLIQNLGVVTKVGLTNGSGYILGAGRSNDLPNIQPGYVWIGNANSVPTPTATSSIQNVVSAQTASYVTTLNQIVNVGTDIQLNDVIGLVTANTYDAGLGTILIDGTAPGGLIDINASTIVLDGNTGDITATTFTGTASYATQALSASYAPGVSKIIAGTNISISPTLGTGDVTINATAADPFPYTGSAIISGSLELSGSFKVQGNGDGFSGPFTAITIDDVNFTRKLHDSQTGSGSLDFGTRDLLDGTGNGVFNWNGITSTIDSRLYLNETIGSSTRDSLVTNIGYGGFSLNEVEFDPTVQTNDLVFLDTDGIWYQVDQTTNTSTKMLGICQGYDPMTYLGIVITNGDIVVSTGGGYPNVNGANYGLPVYIREGSGTLMSTTIPTTGFVRLLGHCYHNPGAGTEWIMKFRPSNEWIEL